MIEFLRYKNFDYADSTVLLRVDLNTGIVAGQPLESPKIREHAKTIKDLVNKKAKVVVLSHQGRRERADFVSLRLHARLLEKCCGAKIAFVPHVVDNAAADAVKSVRKGEAILLENTRFAEDETETRDREEHAQSQIVQSLQPLADCFVLDSFSICHRSHASVVGFTGIPNIAGPVLEKELESLKKIEHVESPFVAILGGNKPTECIQLVKSMPQIDLVLAAGVLADLCLLASGKTLGGKERWLEERGFMPLVEEAKQILQKIQMPVDLGVQEASQRKEIFVQELPTEDLIFDIGEKTIEQYKKAISMAKTIFLKGPLGFYENKEFEKGTREILKAIAKSKAFKFAGGGSTSQMIDRYLNNRGFSFVSLAGGALQEYLSGEEMPGLKALEESYQQYKQA